MYLLATEVLAELVWGHHALINKWYERRPDNEIFTSVISIGLIKSAIENVPIESRDTWRENFTRHRRKLEKTGKIRAVDVKTAKKWALLRTWPCSLPGP